MGESVGKVGPLLGAAGPGGVLEDFFDGVPTGWEVNADAAGNAAVLADNLLVLERLRPGCARLVYVDPPFNTGKRQTRRAEKSRRAAKEESEKATRGFGGNLYVREREDGMSYPDDHGDYISFLRQRAELARRALAADGSMFLHVDWRESARCRIMMDEVFGGPEHCVNEIIWAYDYGARSKSRWPAKHDNILWYANDPGDYVFNLDACDRIEYMSPKLVGEDKARRGKTPTDTWWHTIVGTNSKEKTGYPTQKPLGVLRRIVDVHSDPGDLVVDFFAGSGTTGAAAAEGGRRYLLVDSNEQAMRVMRERLGLRPAGQGGGVAAA